MQIFQASNKICKTVHELNPSKFVHINEAVEYRFYNFENIELIFINITYEYKYKRWMTVEAFPTATNRIPPAALAIQVTK